MLSLVEFGKKLHVSHLWTDVAIGMIALATVLVGERIMGDLFYGADFIFHGVILILAFGAIAAERMLHKHILVHGRLHRIHLLSDASIGIIMVLLIVFGEGVVGEIFWQADIVLHIIIFILAVGNVVAERVIHRHEHSGVIGT